MYEFVGLTIMAKLPYQGRLFFQLGLQLRNTLIV